MLATVLNYLNKNIYLLSKRAPFFGALLVFITIQHQALAFSPERLEIYLQKAQSEKIWTDPQWIKLGHYEKTLFNNYKSSFSTGFFLNEKGLDSPEKEILTTIEALYSDSEIWSIKFKRHPQCQYLARAQWLHKKLNVAAEDILPCKEREDWKKNLNAKEVSIIFAASDFGNASSSFGHTFLKLINPENAKNKDLIDYGVDYAADADSSEGIFYAIKGLIGKYQGRFTMLPFHQKIREYLNAEGRDIWEYKLNFLPEEVDFLINHLLEMENGRAPYFFFNDNCSYQILKALEVVRPQYNIAESFKYFVIPIDTVKKVSRDTDWVEKITYKKSLKTDYLEGLSQLNLLQKKALDEAIEKQSIASDYELTKEEKAAVLETATKYLVLKGYRTNQDLDNEKYQLFVARSALGQISPPLTNKVMEPPQDSHDSSAIYLGYGLQQPDPSSSSSDKQPFYTFKFRNALHNLEQKDFGTVPFSQNEMLTLEARYWQNDQQLRFHKATFLSLINLNPSTQLDRNFSWKVNLALYDQWKEDFEASGGMSLDYSLFSRTRVGFFMTARHWQAHDQEPQQNEFISLNGAGPEILIVSRLTGNIGFSLGATYFLVDKHADYLRLKSKMNINLSKQFDLQMYYENSFNKEQEFGLNLVYNFLM